MLRQALITSSLQMMDVARKLNVDKSLLSRTLSCSCYRSKAFYDELYDLLGNYNGQVPVFENVRAYPTSREAGTWDIYVDDEFFMTFRFQDYGDVVNFVQKDERFQTFQKYFVKGTMFRNQVRLK